MGREMCMTCMGTGEGAEHECCVHCCGSGWKPNSIKSVNNVNAITLAEKAISKVFFGGNPLPSNPPVDEL